MPKHFWEVSTVPVLIRLSAPKTLVSLFVGKDADLRKFSVHKEFACHYLPVLKAAFNSDFIEGPTQTYKFQDTSDGAVRLLLQWLYTQKLDILQLGDGTTTLADVQPELKTKEDMSLAELWVLAEKLLIPRLQNMVVEEIHNLSKHWKHVTTLCLDCVYTNTTTVETPLVFFSCICVLVTSNPLYIQSIPSGFPTKCSSIWFPCTLEQCLDLPSSD